MAIAGFMPAFARLRVVDNGCGQMRLIAEAECERMWGVYADLINNSHSLFFP